MNKYFSPEDKCKELGELVKQLYARERAEHAFKGTLAAYTAYDGSAYPGYVKIDLNEGIVSIQTRNNPENAVDPGVTGHFEMGLDAFKAMLSRLNLAVEFVGWRND